jgi:GT2 family glycosyltransferase
MMVKREVIEKAGMMPECYFLYYEELDWSMMIRRAGYEIWYEPACTVSHKESQTTGQQSPLKTYYITRNRLLFAQRNINGGEKYLTYIYIIGLVAVRDILKYLCKGQINMAKAVMKGIKDFFKL